MKHTQDFSEFELSEGSKVTSLWQFHQMQDQAKERVASEVDGDITALLSKIQKSSKGVIKTDKAAALTLLRILNDKFSLG
jgi:hypothetical protein